MSEKKPNERVDSDAPASSEESQDAAKKPKVRGKRLTTGLRGGLLDGDSDPASGGAITFDTGSSTCRWSCR